MNALGGLADAAFAARIAEQLRRKHGSRVVRLVTGFVFVSEISDVELGAMIRSGFRRARAYGLTWETNLSAFVYLMFAVAPNFDSHPLVRHLLSDPSVAPDSRVEQLWRDTTDENWRAIRRNYDPEVWDSGPPVESR